MPRRGMISTPSSYPASASRGFTLIEILVVVAIIALLISILLPSLARARYQAKSLACRANLHDLGTSFTMYSDQFKGYYPVIWHTFAYDSFQGLYDANLLKNPQILVCPATQNVVRGGTIKRAKVSADYMASIVKDDTGKMIPYIANSDITHHAANAADSSGGHSYEYLSTYGNPTSAKSSDLANRRVRSTHFLFPPSEMLLVHDMDDAQSQGKKGCETSVQGDGNNCPQPWDNHGAEGMNMMFADGHAQFTRKVPGLYKDYSKTPITSFQDENASIDRIWVKSGAPWLFTGR